jgi:hypothetical protein
MAKGIDFPLRTLKAIAILTVKFRVRVWIRVTSLGSLELSAMAWVSVLMMVIIRFDN